MCAPYTVTLVIAIKELFYLKSKIINEKVFLVYKTSDSVKSFFIILNAGKVLFNLHYIFLILQHFKSYITFLILKLLYI